MIIHFDVNIDIIIGGIWINLDPDKCRVWSPSILFINSWYEFNTKNMVIWCYTTFEIKVPSKSNDWVHMTKVSVIWVIVSMFYNALSMIDSINIIASIHFNIANIKATTFLNHIQCK